MPWTCPKCKRTFANPHQWHACRQGPSVDAHFEGRPEWQRKAFDKIVAALEKEGPLRVDPVESAIHLAASSTFAAVKPKPLTLRVGVILDAPVESERVVKRLKLSANRHEVVVELASARDVDRELLGWLRRAYRLRAGS